jgi:Flp pilus assembly protein TadB
MLSEVQKAEIFAVFMFVLLAAAAAAAAFFNKWKRQWDADRAEARVERKEIKENARRAANGSHVQYDKREDDPPKELPL